MANIITQNIRVDLNTGKVIPTAFVHQNDSARSLVFEMYLNGEEYDLTNNTVTFAYVSPTVNGQHTVIAGSGMASGTVDGNKVTVTLPSTYTAISGVGLLTMIITPTSGTIRPVNIRLVVQKSADGPDVIESASDFPETMEEYVRAWLTDHPEVLIDETLTVWGVAADAGATGTAISTLKKNLNSAMGSLLSIANMEFSDITEVSEFNQQNAVTDDYLEDVEYSLDDTTETFIGEYLNIPTTYRKDEPAAFDLDVGVSVPCVAYAQNERTGALITTESSNGELAIYNGVPYDIYHYWVAKKENNSILRKGKFRPTGYLRMLYLPSINNARDIGGWQCDGGRINYGLIFRGCELTGEHDVNITSEDIAVMRDTLDIGYEVDLRSDTETDMDASSGSDDIVSSALGEDIKYKRISLQMYYAGLNIYGSGWEAYKNVLVSIMDSVIAGVPVYVHCVQGADRTGGLIWLIEGILGVSIGDMDKDYELTTFSNEGQSAGRIRTGTQYRSMVDNLIYTIDGDTLMQKCVNWCGYAGIPISKVNQFRQKMINGSPSAVAYTYTDYGVSFTAPGFTMHYGVKRDSTSGQITETGTTNYSATDFIDVGDKTIARLETSYATHRTTTSAQIFCYDRQQRFLGSATTLYTGGSEQFVQCQLMQNTRFVVVRCYHATPTEDDARAFINSLVLYLSYKQPLIECTGITLSKSSMTIDDNTGFTLTANVSPSNCNQPVNWSTSDITIAGVTGGMVVPSETTGTVTITATCGEHSASCVVTVVEHSTSWETVSAPLTLGTKISSSDGVTITTDNNYAASDHINVENYTHIRLSNSYNATSSSSSNIAIYCYDSNGTRTSHLATLNYGTASTGDLEIPTGTVTIRLRVYVDLSSTAKQTYLDATTLELGS